MTDTFLSVKTEGLQEAIDNATNINFTELMDELAEGLIEFKTRLRGTGQRPGDPWPIGTYRISKSGRKYYVPYLVKEGKNKGQRTPGGRRSGRSLRGWKSRQRGISAVVFNDARDKIGGTFYAQHVHLSGKPSGSAAEEAFEIFTEEMEKVADRMIESLTEQISGS
jgi:hypothetical protein